MSKLFCATCGAPTVEEWTQRYDEQTGAKVMRRVCLRDPCNHDKHDGEMIIPPQRWRVLLFGARLRCRRCGHSEHVPAYCL